MALIGNLQRLGIQFSEPWLQGPMVHTGSSVVDAVGADGIKVGGMIFAHSANKGQVILEYSRLKPGGAVRGTALVDNSMGNCKDAASAVQHAGASDHLSIHYTAAYRMGGELDDMEFWMVNIKDALGIPKDECILPSQDVATESTTPPFRQTLEW
eukprot:CAMPEP_0183572100 /NCGR_PEP_ID=MMETSP0371-20130417/127755_1 /TAXON_ID=268820 /ORGANISM="Peridinium aciculiferum, Strain PAER-2" /LENGTH=154 /DNA_ID=CAMNT_0025781927 /DNA_START=132 /DNA_END=593 /DNA_ORIENTATION=+